MSKKAFRNNTGMELNIIIFIPPCVGLLPANQIRLGATPLKGMITKKLACKQDNCLWSMLIPETAVSFA
jgi:hypothetical protein